MEFYNINSFNSSLAPKPYCSNDLNLGLKIRPLDQALKHKYIQANDNYIKFLVIDCDHSDFYLWENKNLASPNLIIKNPQNGHFHAVWALIDPIFKDYINKAKNLAYFAKIQQAYTEILNGDKNYINLIVKNPNHAAWETVQINRFYPYTLDELADFVELPKRITKEKALGEGRNCYLFDAVRKFAYKEILFYKSNGANYTDFYNLLLDKLQKLNVFESTSGLNFNELKAIAKSVAKFCWCKFSAEKFSEIQSARSVKQKIIVQNAQIISELKNEFSVSNT